MLAFPHKTSGLHMWIVKDLADSIDGTAWYSRRPQFWQPVASIALQEFLLQSRNKLLTVTHTLRIARKTWVRTQIITSKQTTKPLVEPIIAASHNNISITSAEGLVRHNIRMTITIALRLFTRN